MHTVKNNRRRSVRLTAAALTAASALVLSACSSGDSDSDAAVVDAPKASDAPQQKSGVKLDNPFVKPDLTLTDTKGEKYDLVKETKGKPTLLYFGYSNCPDACPLIMSNIDLAKRKLPKSEQKKLQVVFVTTDPKRDTPEHLGKWLKAQGTGVTGLTGDFDTIQAAAKSVGIGIEPSYKKKNGDVVSSHGKQLLAFSPKDDKAHYLYTDDKNATAEVLSKDLPKLIKGETP
ncbi:SCO family protein [Streptomyces sp. ODS28]|uniref:SCO family protein n=1 Tax=Streptomyces sp. ODS28 TaxID=3136688 RepID=UPI0031EF5046